MGLDRELEGLLVVSLEQAVAAPYCSLLLADAGARVIKVERPEGDFARGYDRGADGQSVFFALLNRGKESVCIDLNTDDDVTLLRAMLNEADVFLSNIAAGSLERRGFGGEVLRKQNPGLITCAITGYGNEGEAAKKKAYDFLVQAESGLCSVTGSQSQPARVGLSVVDISTGLTAFSAILRALIQRGRTGIGLDINLSMFDVMADWMNMPLMGHRYLEGAPARLGLTHAFIAPYGAFTAGDGDQVLLAIQSNHEWADFCRAVIDAPELIEDPRFKDNPARIANLQALTTMINKRFEPFSRSQIIARLDAARIACSNLNTVADLSAHPLLRQQDVYFGDSILSVADLPVETDHPRKTRVPLLDQQGASVRDEFATQQFLPKGRKP